MPAFHFSFTDFFGKSEKRHTVIEYSVGTCIGSRRQNQDNLRCTYRIPYIRRRRRFSKKGTARINNLEMFCVCDGIGGGERGDLAAKYALKAIKRFFKETDTNVLPLRECVLQAAQRAQDKVCGFYDAIQESGGCTLALLAVRGDSFVFLNIGDSPGFLFPGEGGLIELSRRHNMAWEKKRAGHEANPGDENRLLRYVGMPGTTAEAMAYISTGKLEEGDGVMLCTDGVTNVFHLSGLPDVFHGGLTAGEMVKIAGREERADNCTAICLKVRQVFEISDPAPGAEPYTDSAEHLS